MPMITVRMRVQNRFAYGSASVNGSTPRIEREDHLAAADAIADRSTDDRAGRDGAEKARTGESARSAPRGRSG